MQSSDQSAPEPLPVSAESSSSNRYVRALAVIGVVVGAGLLVSLGLFIYVRSTIRPAPHVKIGVMMPFSGGSSSMGFGAMKGIQLAKQQLAADNIELVQADSRCDPALAPHVFSDLVAQHVVAVIGEGCSSATLAALPVANQTKTVMISPSASSPALSIPDDYFFRTVPSDNLHGAFSARTIYRKGYRTAAVFYTHETYGQSIAKVFKDAFEALGGKVVAEASADPDVISLQAPMNQLKSAHPQAIFIAPNSIVTATAAIKVARDVGITAPFFGGDIFYDTTIIDNAQAAANGLTLSTFATGNSAFKQALLNAYSETEESYAAAQAYDAFEALYLSVQRGAVTGVQIKNILPSIDFQGVSTHIHFDRNGEIGDKNYPYTLLQVRDGKFVAE